MALEAAVRAGQPSGLSVKLPLIALDGLGMAAERAGDLAESHDARIKGWLRTGAIRHARQEEQIGNMVKLTLDGSGRFARKSQGVV